jgi:hypothetical protein
MLDTDATATAVGHYVEGHQSSHYQTPESGMPAHSLLRHGTDIIDLKELQHAESEGLDFAAQLDPSDHGRPLFCGVSSPAALIKKALEYKSAFVDGPIREPSLRALRPHPWETTAVRDTSTFLT